MAALTKAWRHLLRWRSPSRALHLRFGLWRRELRPARANRAIPMAVPDCAACSDNCCTGPHLVSLRLTDIARLHDAGLGDHIVTLDQLDRATVYASHPELREIESRPGFAAFPVLGRSNDGRCPFLSAELRCTIYPIRPVACRRFPLFVGDDLRTVRWASSCESRKDGNPGALFEAALDSYNQRIRDHLVLRYARPVIDNLGLGRYLPRSWAQR